MKKMRRPGHLCSTTVLHLCCTITLTNFTCIKKIAAPAIWILHLAILRFRMLSSCLRSGHPAGHSRGGKEERRGFGPAGAFGGAEAGGREVSAGGAAEGRDREDQGGGR